MHGSSVAIIETHALADPVARRYSGMCEIRDTNGSGSEEVGHAAVVGSIVISA